jgi:hypothetical protein
VPSNYLELDMNWRKPYWIEETAATMTLAHARGTKVGIIINAQGWARI